MTSSHNPLTVATADIDIIEAEPKANLLALQNRLDNLEATGVRADLVVLPELFSTGFISEATRARALAEAVDGPTLTEVRLLARKYSTAIAGTFLCVDGDEVTNRGFVIEPDGESTCYDKRHLFCMSHESDVCRPGRDITPVVRFRGWNMAMAICYDIRFPVWLRNTGNRYDVLIVPANWPSQRAFAWEHLLRARAIENQCYVIGANRSGSDPYGSYDHSCWILDYKGRTIGEDKGMSKVAVLDRQALRAWREKMPVWQDADSFSLDYN